MTTQERFNRHVRKSINGCWLWMGYVTEDGYGSFNTGVKNSRGKFILEGAHRMAYMLSRGVTTTNGLHVMHSCDVKLCVNPAHLTLGTRFDNLADAKERKRLNPPARKGEPRARATEVMVRELRSLYATGLYSLSDLAEHVNLNIKTVSNIVHRRSWKSVA